MNCLKMRISNKKILILPLIIILSLIISFYFGEDTLGGAKHDHFFILKFSLLFSENFSETFNNYGIGILQARNSPIFSIFQSLFINLGADLDILRYLNSLIIIPIFYFFYKSLKIKYPDLSYEVKIIFTSILFLSPTIRSLIIWPYPLIYGLVFFIISNYFFIKFEAVDNEKKKIIFSLYNVFFLAVAAYFTPNFALFSLFYLYKFFLHFKFSKNLYIIIIFNILLALPAIHFTILKDFYFLKMNVTGAPLSSKLNFSNKIILISTIFFFYFIPFIRINKKLFFKRININKNLIFLLIFIVLNIFLFDYNNQTEGVARTGGGLFLHLSQLLFSSPFLVFLIFIIFTYLIFIYDLINLNNIILFFILIVYNAQYSIYHKYFDPLIYIILLFLIKFNYKKIVINLKKISYKYIGLYLFFLLMSFFKNFIINHF